MKVTYEPEDVVDVMDDIDAGEAAGQCVVLISKSKDGFWNVKDADTETPYVVHESFFIP